MSVTPARSRSSRLSIDPRNQYTSGKWATASRKGGEGSFSNNRMIGVRTGRKWARRGTIKLWMAEEAESAASMIVGVGQ